MNDKYILRGKKVIPVKGVLEWGKWFETAGKKRIVKQEDLPNGYWVSTVFLGIDHNFRLSGKPLLFETMVFRKDKRFKSGVNYSDLDMDRYSTWQEAEKGHLKMVKKWLKKRKGVKI